MNERLKELYEQAHERKPVMVVDPQTGNPIQAGWANKPMYGNEFNPEKFAELIVQECMQCSEWVGKVNQNPVEPIHTSHAINQRIRQHFGVKE